MLRGAINTVKYALGGGAAAAVPSGMNPDGAALAAAVPAGMNPAPAALAAAEDKAEVEREIARRFELQDLRSSDLLAGQKIIHCRNRDMCQGIPRVFQYNPTSHPSQYNKHWKCVNNHTAENAPALLQLDWSETNPDQRILRCVGPGCGNVKKEFRCVFISTSDWFCTSCNQYLDGATNHGI